ncbi:monooxygenase [Pseudohyphozyma bogoriensis]|nr:monooxygenase [Pseudohyphozyma bogoriensis]
MIAMTTTSPPISLGPPQLPTLSRLGATVDAEVDAAAVGSTFLTAFNDACSNLDASAFAGLFLNGEGWWRDIMAFTNDYRTLRSHHILQAAKDRLPVVKPTPAILRSSFPPRLVQPFAELDYQFVEIQFDLTTATGPAFGLARLVPSTGGKLWKVFTLFTMLEGVHGHPERVNRERPRGAHNASVPWSVERSEFADFEQHDPDVIIVGGGHNGLELAARLKAVGLEALVVDKQKRTGDNWRLRYESLSLHDPVYANHLSFMPFPANWPIFTPAGKLANWLEAYVDAMDLNVWTDSTTVPDETAYDEKSNTWTVTINRGGSKRVLRTKHVVLATGMSGGFPKMPKPFPGQDDYSGRIVHSSAHGSGKPWKGKKALVVGACTSAHDISLDLVNNGCSVTMLQRSPTFIMTVKNGVPLFHSPLYSEDAPPTDTADRLLESIPKHVLFLHHVHLTPKIQALDADVLSGLIKAGFQLTTGPDGTGWQRLALEKAGGYYFDTGACAKVIDGSIKVQKGEIRQFGGGRKVEFNDGSVQEFDTVIFATGYTGFEDVVRVTWGEKYVAQMDPVFGLDEEGEVRAVARASGIPKMYWMVGHLALARILSKDQPSVSQLSNPLGLLVLASLDVPKVADGPDVGNGADAQASRFDDTTERNSKASSNADLSEDDPTRTHPRDIYFRPAGQPYLLKRKKSPPAACQILNAAQIQELFDIFYNNFHIHAPLLDKEHGSPEQITARSHFLFHAICGIALRAWNGPEETQKKMLKIISAELKLFPQERTLECVQVCYLLANLLCATWNPVAPQHIDLDEQYVRVGLAVRLAMDLGLHETDADRASDVPPWVLRSQRRTWALCFIFDAKLAAHRHRECYTPDVGLLRLEQDGSADDRRMLSSVEWCRIVLQISGLRQRPFNHTSPLGSGMSKQELELEQCASIDARLLQWKDKWVDTFMQASGAVQTLLARTRLYYYYAQLLNYANGLQSLAESEGSSWNDSVYANKYVDVVNRLLYTFIEDFGIHHIAAYLSDLHFTYIAFTAVSLIHSISIGLGRRNHEGPSTLRLLNRVADLFQVSAGQYGHNLKNQAEFIRAVIHAKLDDNGQPRQQPVPVPTDWMGPGFNDVLFGLPSPSNQEISDPWGFAVPVIHEGQSLDAFLNTNQILNNVHQFDYAYWSAALTSRHGSPTLP